MKRLTKTTVVNLYNHPHERGRLTDEVTLPAGTLVRELSRVTSSWGERFELVYQELDGSWYRARTFDRPALEEVPA